MLLDEPYPADTVDLAPVRVSFGSHLGGGRALFDVAGVLGGSRQAAALKKRALDGPNANHILKCIEYLVCLSKVPDAEGKAMSEAELTRIRSDLGVMQRAMGLHLSFGKGMLVFGILLTFAAVGAAVVSLLVENNWLQVAPFATFMAVCLLGLYLQSRRTADLSHEIKLQVGLSITMYFAVFGAACGYALAAFCGPTIGAARTAALYAASLAYVLPFSFILVLNALKNRERHYCLGLAASLLLTGLIIPILDPHYSYPLAHCFMAVGYLTAVAIQWVQLRKAVTHHAAD